MDTANTKQESAAHPARMELVIPAPQPITSSLLSLPDELILEVAGYLGRFASAKEARDLNALSQTCRRLRNIFCPLANRHLLFDEENQFPDTLLNIIIYSFTDPLVDYVESATFRLLGQDAFWLRGEYDEIIETQMARLKEYLMQKADGVGNEVFRYFESHIDEYGMAILPTVLIFQLKQLKELEIAASIPATSSRFLVTTLHHFQPPFKLERWGMVRWSDFAPVNYWLFERLLRLGPIETVGIDYRWGSTNGHPKIRPVPDFSSDVEEESEYTSDDDSFVESLCSGDRAAFECPWYNTDGNLFGNDWAEELDDIIEKHYKGYEKVGSRDREDGVDINYDLPGANSTLDTDITTFDVQNLRLWMDETPPIHEQLVQLLIKVRNLCSIDLNLLFKGHPTFGGLATFFTTDFHWLVKLLEPQKDTLESLMVQIMPLGTGGPHIPLLVDFTHLRKVQLPYNYGIADLFRNLSSISLPYFERMFPEQLESLRIDFCYDPKFIESAISLSTEKFPNLKVTFGIFKDEKVKWELAELWDSMPYSKNNASGLWEETRRQPEKLTWMQANEKVGSESSPYSFWRRWSFDQVPIRFLNISSDHRDVFRCSEGWHGPFQAQTLSDYPWDSDTFNSLPVWSGDSGDLRTLDVSIEPWRGSIMTDFN